MLTITYNSVKVNKTSAQITIHDYDARHLSDSSKEYLLALMFLMGGYNHMRIIEKGFSFDLEKYSDLQKRFESLLNETVNDMNIDGHLVKEGLVFKG